MTGPPPLVALRGVALGYRRARPLLEGVDVGVAPGDFLAVVGPNGGGKTTLLRTLVGGLAPLTGERVAPRSFRVGYVPQRDQVDALWPFTAGEVVMMGRTPLLGPLRRPGAADVEAGRAALGRVGLEGVWGLPLAELSGGQRQRTLIARALAGEPELLALDEPTSGMDPAAELATMDLLRALHHGGGLAVVMVSHRLEAVANYAHTLAFVDAAKGLFQVGPLHRMLTPEALGALYGRPVAVREEDGRRFVHPVADEARQ